MSKPEEITIQFSSGPVPARDRVYPRGQVRQPLQIEPTERHPVDYLLPQSHLQRMKLLLEFSEVTAAK